MQNNINTLKLDKSKWKLTKLGELADEISVRVDNPSKSKYDRFVGLEHFVSGDIKIKNWGTTENLVSSTKAFQKGDILFARRNAYLRRASLVEFDGCCSGDAFVFRENHDKVVPGFLAFLMNSNALWDYANSNAAGTMSKRVKWRDLEEYEFLLPPKDQQAQLAELLWAMDEVIERDREVMDKLKSIYLSKVEKQLINKNDKKVYFKDLGKVIRGVGYKPEDLLDNYNEESCIILRSNNIFESNINYDDIKILSLQNVKKEQVLIDGDFAICMSNGSKELVGKSALYISEGKNVSIGSFCAGFRPNSDLSGNIIEHLFASESYRQAIKQILTGSAINNLKPSDIEEMSLRIENDKDKLITLLAELKLVSNNIKELNSKIQSSISLQKSLINHVFSASAEATADK